MGFEHSLFYQCPLIPEPVPDGRFTPPAAQSYFYVHSLCKDLKISLCTETHREIVQDKFLGPFL